MHIHVNTASEHLRDFAERLPELFDREGEVLHAGRNTIKAFEAEHGPIEGPIDPGLNVKPGRHL